MLRLTASFVIAGFLFISIFVSRRVESLAILTRLTNTPEQTVNLNPTLSDDGKVVVFESSADLSGAGASSSFHTFRADLNAATPAFVEVGSTRAVCPALS